MRGQIDQEVVVFITLPAGHDYNHGIKYIIVAPQTSPQEIENGGLINGGHLFKPK